MDDHFFVLKKPTGVPSIPWSGDGLTADLTSEGTIPEETFKYIAQRAPHRKIMTDLAGLDSKLVQL